MATDASVVSWAGGAELQITRTPVQMVMDAVQNVFYHCSHQMGALSLKSFSEAWMTLVLSQARMLAPRKKPTSQ
ncbi:hypothetical protein PBY51_006542 [Eleginops maclovinus]|uniref:Uncharacterized protein n=1 Tax=Eleginops maclovinus TaxID=56733 RepID=A0AAN7X044_ELEMC|nr:hypothetical protein PBY51_006542 [Eleginops maclovinus]